MVFSDLIQDFDAYLRETKKASSNTCSNYLRDVRQFGEWLAGQSLSSYRDVTQEMIMSYLQKLQEDGKSAATQSRCAASLRCLYTYLSMNLSMQMNPASQIHPERQERKLPQILTGKEVELFLEQPKSQDLKGIRDKAMLELLYATGIRVSELISLNLEDVNLSVGFVRCLDGEKERMVPMYRVAVRAVQDYIDHVRPLMVEDEQEQALFVNIGGSRMSRQGFWKLVKYYQHKAGIDKEITPHTLRHSFAAHLLEHGADIHDVQELLGHADVSTTQVYARLVQTHLTQAYMKAHPRA